MKTLNSNAANVCEQYAHTAGNTKNIDQLFLFSTELKIARS